MAEPAFKLMDSSLSFEDPNPFEPLTNEKGATAPVAPTRTEVLTKHNLLDPEPAPNPKRLRIIAEQQYIDEEEDAAIEETIHNTLKVKDLIAVQDGKIQSALEEIKSHKDAKIRLEPELRDAQEVIEKLENPEKFKKIAPHKDPRRLANFNVQSPYEAKVTKVLGKSRIQRSCFGCVHGIGVPIITEKIMESFETFLYELFMNIDFIEASKQGEVYFNENVRQVDPKTGIPKLNFSAWTKRDIFDHMKSHQTHESLKLRFEIHRIEEIMEIIRNNEMFTVPTELMTIAHRAAEVSDIGVDYKAVKHYMELSSHRRQLATGDPKKHILQNTRVKAKLGAGSVLTKGTDSKQPIIPSLFKPKFG